MVFGNEMKILVTYVGDYSMLDTDTKQVVEGCTVHYFFYGENGEALKPGLAGSGPIGYQRAKVSLPLEARSRFAAVPGIFNGSFEMTTGSDGKPVLKLVNIGDFLGFVDFVCTANQPDFVRTDSQSKDAAPAKK